MHMVNASRPAKLFSVVLLLLVCVCVCVCVCERERERVAMAISGMSSSTRIFDSYKRCVAVESWCVVQESNNATQKWAIGNFPERIASPP